MANSESSTAYNRFKARLKPLPPTNELLQEAQRIYAYSEEHRGLIWNGHKNPKRPWPRLGTVVGGDDGHGYKTCLVLGHKFKVHQIVWLLHYGQLASMSIDHINGVKLDNRIANLRLVTDQQNSMNVKTAKRRFAGVKTYKNKEIYSAVVQHKGKKHYFGGFKTKAEAHAAYVEGKRKICGEYSPI